MLLILYIIDIFYILYFDLFHKKQSHLELYQL